MFKSLKQFNFGTELIQWIKLFYTDISTIIINNGHLSEPIPIQRGVKQGCPLSTTLFILSIEILSNYIEKNEDIKGIKIKEQEIKQTLFADDTTYLTDGTLNSFSALINTIQDFSEVSGLKLNTQKTIVMRVGALKNTHIIFNKYKHFTWTSEEAKTLGFYFTNDENLNIDKNIQPKLQAFKNCLKQWHHRKLTLLGKVTVVKTFALPKIMYTLSALPNPNHDIIQTINKSIYQFVWDGKPDKIKRTTLVKRIEQGGLKLTDITAFLYANKASWVKRLTDINNTGQWKIFYQNELYKYGGDLVFECTLNDKHINSNFKNVFLRDVISSWNKIKSKETEGHVTKTIIWNNSTIVKNNQHTFFYQNWFNMGVKFLEHIYDFRSKSYYTFEAFKTLYEIPSTDYLKYYTLIKSIPITYTQQLSEMEYVNFNNNTLLEKVQKTKTVCKYLYNLQQTLEENKTKQEQKWEEIMSPYEQSIDWKHAYITPFKATIDNTLRNFQYKILQCILPTNSYLFKCNLISSSLCTFCSSCKETIIHVLYECNSVQPIWRELTLFLNSRQLHIDLNVNDIVFGTKKGGNYNQVINYIIILMKSYIFNTKSKAEKPNIETFKNALRMKITLEKQIAFEKNKIDQHNKKWHNFAITF
jgi:hypothetical protein